MRRLADAERVRRFVHELARAARHPTRLYLVGGATAVLLGWRPTTIDVDVKLVPESDELLRALVELKESLEVNVELAAPSDFIPALPGWEDRSPFVAQEGPLAVYHYDLYSQALAKVERGHAQDVADVRVMLRTGLVEPARLRDLFARIEPELFRYPAIDARSFRDAVEQALRDPEATP
jgi:hypothetical protein